MKDYYDLWVVVDAFKLEQSRLVDCNHRNFFEEVNGASGSGPGRVDILICK